MKSILALAFLSLAAFAQVINHPGAETFHVNRQLIPASATDILVGDVYFDELQLAVVAAPATCSVYDKQPTPQEILPPISIASAGIVAFTPRTFAPGGVTWSCSAGTVKGYITYRKPI